MDKDIDNAIGDILERLIKPRESTTFVHPAYYLDGPDPLIAVSGTNEEFFNSALEIWIGEKIRWILQTNQDAQSMEGLSTKTS